MINKVSVQLYVEDMLMYTDALTKDIILLGTSQVSDFSLFFGFSTHAPPLKG